MRIDRFDHVVLTVRDVDASVTFYTAIGMTKQEFDGRTALHFGDSKFNLQQAEHTIDPKAAHPTGGSADFCLITLDAFDAVQHALEEAGIATEVGPVQRTGATGTIRSVYVRDPDGNLVEISSYDW